MILSRDRVRDVVDRVLASSPVSDANIDWDAESSEFLRLVAGLESSNSDATALGAVLPPLSEICAAAIRSLARAGHDAETVTSEILKAHAVEIRAVHTSVHYRNSAASIARTALVAATTLVGEARTLALFR